MIRDCVVMSRNSHTIWVGRAPPHTLPQYLSELQHFNRCVSSSFLFFRFFIQRVWMWHSVCESVCFLCKKVNRLICCCWFLSAGMPSVWYVSTKVWLLMNWCFVFFLMSRREAQRTHKTRNYFTNINKNETIKMTYSIKLNSFNFCMATTLFTECTIKFMCIEDPLHIIIETEIEWSTLKRCARCTLHTRHFTISKLHFNLLLKKVCSLWYTIHYRVGCVRLCLFGLCVSSVCLSDGFNFLKISL